MPTLICPELGQPSRRDRDLEFIGQTLRPVPGGGTSMVSVRLADYTGVSNPARRSRFLYDCDLLQICFYLYASQLCCGRAGCSTSERALRSDVLKVAAIFQSEMGLLRRHAFRLVERGWRRSIRSSYQGAGPVREHRPTGGGGNWSAHKSTAWR